MKIRVNSPCLCGSGRKYKRCCARVAFDMPPGVEGLKRPEPIPVEASFNEFVKEVGGELVGDLIPKDPNQPKNADYLFTKSNVVVELKCFEKDLFNTPEDVPRIGKIIERHNEKVTGSEAIQWLYRRRPAPKEYRRDMLSLARRQIEGTVRTANKQIQATKEVLNIPDARGLVLLANDGNYFLEPMQAFYLIIQVMIEHFMDCSIDGFVYFSVNVAAEDPRTDRELMFWMPSYNKEDDVELSSFVNRLGADWNSFYSRKIGQDVPNFQTDDFRSSALLRLLKPKP